MPIPIGILASASSENFTFTTFTLPTALFFRGGIYENLANAKYFLFGDNDGAATTSYLYSTNGTSWTTGTLPDSQQWGKAASNGTRVVVIPWVGRSAAYTTNGTTWSSSNIWGSSQNSTDIIWTGTRFLVTGSDTSTNISSSTDGVSWTASDVGNGFRGIAYDGVSKYIATTGSTTARVTTGDPTTTSWTNLTVPISGDQILYQNGIWLIFGGGDVATSPDGVTWATSTPTFIGNVQSVSFLDNKFYTATVDTVNDLIYIYTSTNGLIWKQKSVIANPTSVERINAWANGPTTMIAAGYRSAFNDNSDGAIRGVI